MHCPRTLLASALLAPMTASTMGAALFEADLALIERVEVLPNRVLAVNGTPLLPRMAWLQDPGNFGAVKASGMNVVAGYWPCTSDAYKIDHTTE